MLSNFIIIIMAIVLFIIGYKEQSLNIQGIAFALFGCGIFWGLIVNFVKWLKSLLP